MDWKQRIVWDMGTGTMKEKTFEKIRKKIKEFSSINVRRLTVSRLKLST